MKPNEIRGALVLRNITVTSIAKKIGAKRPNVSAVIAGNLQTVYVQEAIAAAIGKPVDEVFPVTNQEKAA